MTALNQILQGMHPDHADLLEAQGKWTQEDKREYEQFLDEETGEASCQTGQAH